MTEENQMAEEPITTDGARPELPQAATEQVTLGVVDLQNAAQVIDVAVSRGAFRAAEAAQVGTVFNRLTSFIQSVQAQQTPPTTEEGEAVAAPTTEAQ
jgi:hypothetical protein|tara:strand:- start:1492 stop:1785 length:294 start_codon:yes stop_codon:yes gene_type:complete